MVPLSISTADSPNAPVKTIMLDSKKTQVVLNGVSANTWVKLNPGTIGVYRLVYFVFK